MQETDQDPRVAYLKHRAEQHEILCRMVASQICQERSPLVFLPCRRRLCRRNRLCSGPMRPSPHLLHRLEELRKIGFPKGCCTELPACLSIVDEEAFKNFERVKQDATKMLAENPDLTWPDLAEYYKYMTTRRGAASHAMLMQQRDAQRQPGNAG